ncbi:MAG: FAD-dependent oxidoreductase [Pirellulaceae bacterium]|nr:FAD-dependent oxidoreductase [Pirellulaceae bacterium]
MQSNRTRYATATPVRQLALCVALPLLAVACWVSSPAPTAAADSSYDVVIYGGTSAGVAAAVQCVRMNKTVIVIEPGRHLGGLTTGGLGWTDSGDKRVIGGVSREFYRAVKQHYDDDAAWKFERAEAYGRYRPQDDAMWTFEPRVAEQIVESWMKRDKIRVVRGERLNRASGVSKEGARIAAITCESGRVYRGAMFIDATYEGDLLAAAGVSYAVGREANSLYDETLNGVQKRQNTHKHRFVKNVDPYVKPGDPASGLLPGVSAKPPGEDGTGDKRLQAYCYRLCMSNVAANRTPFRKPDGYDERQYELLLRNFEAGDMRLPLKPDMMPNGKTDTNNNCAVSTDNIGMNYSYPEASYAERERILAEHRRYQEGLMWTLSHHPRAPASIKREMSRWGLAADEFVDNDNWPHQIYVREARRMVGEYVTTEHDCRRLRIVKDSVGLGSYNMDSHNTQRYVTPDGYVQNEGDVQVSPGGPYLVSYRSLTPRRAEATNLLVPVCLSSSHIAYGSIRMEPVFMVLGQSAATAAALAIDGGTSVQDVPYDKLRARLLADKQVLDLPPQTKSRPVLSSLKQPGIVVDDGQATLRGAWTPSSSTPPFLDGRYLHDGNMGQGEKTATFQADLKAGKYEVRLYYAPHSNRASNANVTVHSADGSKTFSVNQRAKHGAGRIWRSLGLFDCDGSTSVVVSNEGANGYVIADAVSFVAQ